MYKLITILFVFTTFFCKAQRYLTKTGTIEFSASSPVEKIEGVNKAVACVLDAKTGMFNCIVQIKSFVFRQQLMQEHFNENYLESDQIPTANFKGSITNIADIIFNKDGDYTAEVTGKLTIHGVTKDVKTKGRVIVKNGKPTIKSNFNVLLSDYNINIPGAVKDKISKEAKVNVICALEPLK